MPTLVQKTSKDAGTVSSTTLAFASNNTAGNLLYATVRLSALTTCTITDSVGNTWNEVAHQDGTEPSRLFVFYVKNCGAGANTLTITAGASNAMRLCIAEYSGLDTVSPLDKSAVATNAFGTAVSVGPITTAAAGELITVAWGTSGSSVATAGSGYTVQQTQTDRVGFEDKTGGAAGSETGTVTLATGVQWAAVMVSFLPVTQATPDQIFAGVRRVFVNDIVFQN